MNGSLRLLLSACVAFTLAWLNGGRAWMVGFGCTVGGLFAGLALAGWAADRRGRGRFTPGEFTVVLKDAGANKVNTIRAMRAATACGLRQAKDLVDRVPATLSAGISREDAIVLARRFDGVATVSIQEGFSAPGIE